LADEFPVAPGYRSDLAGSHSSLASLLLDLGKQPEAEDQYRQAVAIQEKLAAEFPAQPGYHSELARNRNSLGVLLRRLGRGPEAEQQYLKALAIQEKLAADFPALPEYRISLGGSYCNFGNLLLAGGNRSRSLEWFARVIGTLAPIHQQEPRDALARQFLRNSHWARAMAHDQLQQFAEAIPDWDKAIELSSKEEQPGMRASRAISRVNAGQAAQAVAEVAELTKSSDWSAGQWYNLACVFAIASDKLADKKQEYADRAMELLHKAVNVGFQDAAHIKQDNDLDALRARDDFQKLLAELEQPAEKK
jgi:tetratricopeptide (TPR) repeat protein